MNLVRFDPLRELEGLSGRLNRLFDGPLANKMPDERAFFGDWTPAMDIEETDGEYLLKTDLPAMKREEVKVGITDGVLGCRLVSLPSWSSTPTSAARLLTTAALPTTSGAAGCAENSLYGDSQPRV